MPAQFTLFFDGQFWRGVYETSSHHQLRAVMVTFGPEPTNAQLYDWMLIHGAKLVRDAHSAAPVSGTLAAPTRGNPKRLRRAINKKLKEDGPSSKAQDALHLDFELAKAHQKKVTIEQRRKSKERSWKQRQEKRISKRKGK